MNKLLETILLPVMVLGVFCPSTILLEAKSFREIKAKAISNDDESALTEPDEPKPKSETHHATRAPASAKPKKPARPAVKETQADSPVPESPQEEETRLTKNWGGLRKTLSAQGLDLAIIYKGEYNSVLSGGLKSQSEYLGNLDLRMSVDLDKAAGWKGGSLFFYALANHGGDPSKNVGDSQVSSNIETPVDTLKLYEFWLQQFIYEDKFSVLAGLHDLNSEFYNTDTSGLFLNSSFGVGKELAQTGSNGPSIFPTTAPSIRLRAESSKSFYIQTALFNGLAGSTTEARGTQVSLSSRDGLLVITEAAYLRGKETPAQLPGKYALGYWTYTRTFDHWVALPAGSTEPQQSISNGLYLLMDQGLTESMSVFFRYGIASTTVNRFGSCLGAGLVYTGMLPYRPKDRFGFGIARATSGDEYRVAQEALGNAVLDTETAYELDYRVELVPGVAVQPSFQYIVHPNTDPTISDAKVGAIRFEISF